jgi:arylsulfatase A-like enzyme
MQAENNSQTLSDFPTAGLFSESKSASAGGLVDLGKDLLNSIPNRVVLAVVVIGVVAELIALSQMEQPLMHNGWRVALLAPMFIAWFWLTIGLFLHKASAKLLLVKKQGVSAKSVLCFTGFFAAFVMFVGAYATSWGLFLKTSRFANWEVLRFSIQNVGELVKYVTAAEPTHLIYGAIVMVVGSAGLWLLLKPFSKVAHPVAECPLPLNRLWFLMTTLTLASLALVQHDSSVVHAQRNLIALKHGLNPTVTLVGTAVESLRLAPIDQVFADPDQELQALSTKWSPALGEGYKASDLPSIIMIQVESLRSDVVYAEHQGREVMPHLNKLAKKSLVWKNAYAQSTHSDYADPCIVSSLYPLRTRTHHYYGLDDPWPKQLSYDCLKQLGYSTATISSQNEMWGRMEHFLVSPNLDFFYHPERAENATFAEASEQDPGFYLHLESGALKAGKFPDRHTADVAIDWIKRTSKSDKPFLLNMNLQSSHFPYIIPAEASKPFQPCDLPSDASFAWYDPSHTETVRNAYYNALHEIDSQLGRLLTTLEESDQLENTIIVVLGENGESFHENNQVCHANKPYDSSTHIAAVMYGPKWLDAREEAYPLEHVDILPTLFRRIGLEPHPNFQGIDALASDRPQWKDRFLYFHTLSPLSATDGLQWAGRWKYMWDCRTQEGELYDLHNDPTEQNNLAAQHPQLAQSLHDQLGEWRSRQLAWYHFPSLYQQYYPPKPPTSGDELPDHVEDFISSESADGNLE